MKKLFLSICLTITMAGMAQSTCETAYNLCGSIGLPFANSSSGGSANPASAAGYGCLATTHSPTWFYLPVSQAGNLILNINQKRLTGQPMDVDYIVWGPFTSNEVCSPANLNPGTQVACNYGPSAVEYCTIPNVQPGQFYMLMVTNYFNHPGTITINYVPGSTGAIDCSGLKLNAYIDANTNGQFDTGEAPFLTGTFTYEKNNDGEVHNASNTTGFHNIYDPNLENTYSAGLTIPPALQAYVTGPVGTLNNLAVNTSANIVTHKFPVVITQPFEDLSVNVIPYQGPVPGFAYKNYVVYRNQGPLPVSGTITFTKDAAIAITTISEAGATATPAGFTFNFTNLQPFETKVITVEFTTPVLPTVSLGQIVTHGAAISSASSVSDIDPVNNSSSVSQAIVGSYDPNDKMESHGSRIQYDQFTANDYLYYTIRFQNKGNASAINVRIEDVLDSQLNASSFEMIRASHNFTVDRVGNHITWKFNQIMLPHEAANEPASHGYVYFRIKPNAGFDIGDVIPNAAGIYFDFNPVIVTNTFETEFFMPLATTQFDMGNFTMFPNPAKQSVTVNAPAGGQNLAQVRLVDVTGKTLFVKDNLNSTSATLDVSSFGTGMYFMEITGENGAKATKKLMVQ